MLLKDPVQESDAMGVLPRQVPEANERLVRLGIDGKYKRNGVFKGRRSQVKKLVDEENARRGDRPKIVNYDGGYGDPT